MSEFQPGDRVYVTDPGLAELRAIMRAAGREPFPNHHGTVNRVWDDGMILIFFDNEDGPGCGSSAPYPVHEVRHLTDEQTPADDPYATWHPEQATDDPDGLPDRAIVPLVESLRERGIVTLQSCYGHLGSDDGQLWVRADSVDGAHIRRFLTGDPFDRVQFVYQPDAPHWEFIWHAARADAALEALATLLPAVTSVDPTPAGLTDADLAAIEARAEAATSGPWHAGGNGPLGGAIEPHELVLSGQLPLIELPTAADAEFVAHARQDVPALLALVRRLQAERDVARRDGLRWSIRGHQTPDQQEGRQTPATAGAPSSTPAGLDDEDLAAIESRAEAVEATDLRRMAPAANGVCHRCGSGILEATGEHIRNDGCTSVPDQPDGIDETTNTVPDPARAADRVDAWLSEWGDGLIDVTADAPLYARDLAVLADMGKAERDVARRDGAADALERVRASQVAFSAALGFGDNVTEPAAPLADMLDPIAQAMAAAEDHTECAMTCELCGDPLAVTLCERCGGGGDIGAGAYSECPDCAGAGRIHEGCAEVSYTDLVAERDAAETELARMAGDLDDRDATLAMRTGQLQDARTRIEELERQQAGPEQYVVLNDADYDERYSTRGEALEMAAALAADTGPAHRWRAYRLAPLAATPPADTAGFRTSGETLNEVAADSGPTEPCDCSCHSCCVPADAACAACGNDHPADTAGGGGQP